MQVGDRYTSTQATEFRGEQNTAKGGCLLEDRAIFRRYVIRTTPPAISPSPPRGREAHVEPDREWDRESAE